MKVRIHYPLQRGALFLRTDADWEHDLAPTRVRGGSCFEFDLGQESPFRYFKAVLRDGDELRWAQGTNGLAVEPGTVRDAFPYFEPDSTCHVCDVHGVPSTFEERGHDVRVFLPPGYDENPLEHYPCVYMQDGQNLFFPDEAFGGKHWRVQETLSVLNSMNLVRQVIVVGVYPRERMREYTAPGYDSYARFLAQELKPWVDERYRTLRDPSSTAVMGSSLGGVLALHACWEHPESFGNAACMSSTFGFRDDLLERVLHAARRPIRVYLDSGWPGDNYEVNLGMRQALVLRGYREGVDLRYNAFPLARHDEESWASRVHLPLQFFFGAFCSATEGSRRSRRRVARVTPVGLQGGHGRRVQGQLGRDGRQ